VAQIYPRALGSLSVASYDSQGYDGGVLCSIPPPHPKLYIFSKRGEGGMRESSWSRHCATRGKVADSVPDEVTE
jgi:hypothetical protein